MTAANGSAAHGRTTAAVLALLALAVGGAAAAQAQAPARFGQPGAPIDISAASTQVFQTEQRIVYKGEVEALQGQTRLRTPQLTIFYNKNNAVRGQAAAEGAPGAVQRMEALGPVYFVTPTQQAKGDMGVFDAATDTVTLAGNVTLIQDRNVATGDRLVINQKTGEVTLLGGGKAGRVRGVFYQSEKAATAEPGAAPSPPAPRR